MMHSTRKIWGFGVLSVGLLLAGLFVSYRAYAATGACGNCKLTSIGMTSTGWVMIGTSLNMAGPCSNPTFMVFDPNSVKGTAAMALASAAFLSGARVDLNGTNSCSTSSGAGVVAENLNTILLR